MLEVFGLGDSAQPETGLSPEAYQKTFKKPPKTGFSGFRKIITETPINLTNRTAVPAQLKKKDSFCMYTSVKARIKSNELLQSNRKISDVVTSECCNALPQPKTVGNVQSKSLTLKNQVPNFLKPTQSYLGSVKRDSPTILTPHHVPLTRGNCSSHLLLNSKVKKLPLSNSKALVRNSSYKKHACDTVGLSKKDSSGFMSKKRLGDKVDMFKANPLTVQSDTVTPILPVRGPIKVPQRLHYYSKTLPVHVDSNLNITSSRSSRSKSTTKNKARQFSALNSKIVSKTQSLVFPKNVQHTTASGHVKLDKTTLNGKPALFIASRSRPNIPCVRNQPRIESKSTRECGLTKPVRHDAKEMSQRESSRTSTLSSLVKKAGGKKEVHHVVPQKSTGVRKFQGSLKNLCLEKKNEFRLASTDSNRKVKTSRNPFERFRSPLPDKEESISLDVQQRKQQQMSKPLCLEGSQTTSSTSLKDPCSTYVNGEDHFNPLCFAFPTMETPGYSYRFDSHVKPNHQSKKCTTSLRRGIGSQYSIFKNDSYFIDSHSNLGDWMVSVDLAVAEKALAEESNSLDSKYLSVTAKSLGSLSLLAAEAAEVAATPLYELCSLNEEDDGENIKRDDIIKPLLSTRVDLESLQERPSDNSTLCIESTSFPLSPHCTSVIESAYESSNNEKFEYVSDGISVKLQQGPEERPSTCYLLATPCNTPIPHLVKNLENVEVKDKPSTQIEGETMKTMTSTLCSPTSTSFLLRAPNRQTLQGRSKLLRGITLCDVEDVINAVTLYGVDPNDYCLLPTKRIPWTIAAPVVWPLDVKKELLDYKKKPLQHYCVRLHPLHLAAAISSPKVVQTLLQLNACPNALDEWCRNPLHILLQPPPLAFSVVEEFVSKAAELSLDEGQQDLLCKLFMFLLKQTSPRSRAETQIAEILCNAGLDINFKDRWDRNCVDYATAWSQIRRMIRSSFSESSFKLRMTSLVEEMGIHLIESPKKSYDPENDSVEHSETVETLVADALQKHLLLRVPEGLLDVVLLHEDRLRLQALRSIVGIRAGASQLPRDAVKIHLRQSVFGTKTHVKDELNLINHTTPLRDDDIFNPSSGLTDCTRTKDLGNSKVFSLRTELSQVKHWTPCSGPSIQSFSNQLNSQDCDSNKKANIIQCNEAQPLSSLRLSCLRALNGGQRSCYTSPLKVSESPSPKDLKPNFNLEDRESRDVATFLRLLSLPSYRYHPAFSGVWEYLGATLFSEKDLGARNSMSKSPFDSEVQYQRGSTPAQLPAFQSVFQSPTCFTSSSPSVLG